MASLDLDHPPRKSGRSANPQRRRAFRAHRPAAVPAKVKAVTTAGGVGVRVRDTVKNTTFLSLRERENRFYLDSRRSTGIAART